MVYKLGMQVKFSSYLRNYTGCSQTEVPAAATVSSLIYSLGERYGPGFRGKIPDIMITVNGKHISHLGGIDTPLKDDDTVQIFPMVIGG